MEDTDLTGLDLSAAKEYILAYAVDVKRLEKEIADAGADLERWKARLALAEGKLGAGDQAMAALVQAARSKVEEAGGKLAFLESELADLRSRVARMTAQLPAIKARERSVDPDRLLAELQMMTGELLGERSLDAEFAKLDSEAKADSELEALKRRASEGEER